MGKRTIRIGRNLGLGKTISLVRSLSIIDGLSSGRHRRRLQPVIKQLGKKQKILLLNFPKKTR